MKWIIIQWDFSSDVKSYIETLELIKKDINEINTNCLNFFNFDYLKQGYDVKVIKQSGDHIVLSELLTDKENEYTTKEIRWAHNTQRLLIAGALDFKNGNLKGSKI